MCPGPLNRNATLYLIRHFRICSDTTRFKQSSNRMISWSIYVPILIFDSLELCHAYFFTTALTSSHAHRWLMPSFLPLFAHHLIYPVLVLINSTILSDKSFTPYLDRIDCF